MQKTFSFLFFLSLLLNSFALPAIDTFIDTKSVCIVNAKKQRLLMEDARGITKYLYDQEGNLIKIIFPDELAISFQYNDNHQISEVTYPNGKQVFYEYDNNQITTITDNAGVTYIEYNPQGFITKILRPNNIISEFIYNDQQKLLTSLHKTYNDKMIIKTDFVYDDQGNVITEIITTPEKTLTTSYEKDKRKEVKKYPHLTLEYFYDNENRIICQKQNDHILNYCYDGNNNLLQIGDIHFETDKKGNITKKKFYNIEIEYFYDSRNRLIKYQDGDKTIEYIYNGDNILTHKKIDGFTINFYQDKHLPIPYLLYKTAEKHDSLAKFLHNLVGFIEKDEIHYVYGTNLLHGYSQEKVLYYLLKENQNCVSMIVDEQQKKVYDEIESSYYHPLVDMLLQVDTTTNNVYFDTDTGLYLEKGRWFDPHLYIHLNKNLTSYDRIEIVEEEEIVEEDIILEMPLNTEDTTSQEIEENIPIETPQEEVISDDIPSFIEEEAAEQNTEEIIPDIILDKNTIIAKINEPLGIFYDEQTKEIIYFGKHNALLDCIATPIFYAILSAIFDEQNPWYTMFSSSSVQLFINDILQKAAQAISTLAIGEDSENKKTFAKHSSYQNLPSLFKTHSIDGHKNINLTLLPLYVQMLSSDDDKLITMDKIKLYVLPKYCFWKQQSNMCLREFSKMLSENMAFYIEKNPALFEYYYLTKLYQLGHWLKKKNIKFSLPDNSDKQKGIISPIKTSTTEKWSQQEERKILVERKKWYGTKTKEKTVTETVEHLLHLSIQVSSSLHPIQDIASKKNHHMNILQNTLLKTRPEKSDVWEFTLPNSQQKVFAVAFPIKG